MEGDQPMDCFVFLCAILFKQRYQCMFYDDNNDENEEDQKSVKVQRIEVQVEEDRKIQNEIDLNLPGLQVQLPEYIIRQLQNYWPAYKKRLIFFGGHPVSITKLSCNQIFTSINQNRQSPYLVCEKTDGVRYILLVAKVKKVDLHRQKYAQEQGQDLYTQSYFISRQGQGKITAYVIDIGISFRMEQASSELDNGSKYVIQILDGQLIQEQDKVRYLIFDGLIHLGRDICRSKLRERLECMTNFMRCNSMLGIQPHLIQVKIKDFFRLSCRKFNMVQFMLQKYVKCLSHENDGLIFNHDDKEYILGSLNQGYIKWKPDQLNTVDFMIVPNLNLEQKIGRRVLDLYLGIKDKQLDRYFRQFYAFAIVTQAQFNQYHQMYEQIQHQRFEANNNGFDNQDGEFKGAIIAQCRYETTKIDERNILKELYKMKTEVLVYDLMKQGQQNRDKNAIDELKKQIYDKGWKIYKIRVDKSMPNNFQVTKKIEQSIRDNISEKQLINKNRQLNRSLGYV